MCLLRNLAILTYFFQKEAALIKKKICVGVSEKIELRPLQFNYLSYELFLEKKPVRLQKKRKKKSSLVSYGRKWF